MLSTISPSTPFSPSSLNLSVSSPVSEKFQTRSYHFAEQPPASSSPDPQDSWLGTPEPMDCDEYGECEQSTFESLPIEIHEAVLDYLFGARGSAIASVPSGKAGAGGSWSKALRHPRRKILSNLALVSRKWRPLVQERIYRHSRFYSTPLFLTFTSHIYLCISD